MTVLIIFIMMTRGANVQVEVPFETAAACEKAAKTFSAVGMSSVVIAQMARCEGR